MSPGSGHNPGLHRVLTWSVGQKPPPRRPLPQGADAPANFILKRSVGEIPAPGEDHQPPPQSTPPQHHQPSTVCNWVRHGFSKQTKQLTNGVGHCVDGCRGCRQPLQRSPTAQASQKFPREWVDWLREGLILGGCFCSASLASLASELVSHRSNRAYPDVAAFGEFFFLPVNPSVKARGNVVEQGTSASAPLVGGIATMLVNLARKHDGKPIGFLNPFLYQMFGPFSGDSCDAPAEASLGIAQNGTLPFRATVLLLLPAWSPDVPERIPRTRPRQQPRPT